MPAFFDTIRPQNWGHDMAQANTATATPLENQLAKYQLVEVDSSVRPARVTVLSTHDTEAEAKSAWKASAFSKIDFYDISHSIIEV